jgi:DNA repair protein RadC
VSGAHEVCQIMHDIQHADRESFWALHLDVRNRIIDVDKVATGDLTGVQVHPREVFRAALLTGASSIVFAHNHPSGDPSPSRQDEYLTRRLKDVGDLVGVRVLDHIVIGRDGKGCESLAARGILGEGRTADYPLLARLKKASK